MKLIEQSAELWQQGWKEDDIWNHIARCTRVCYQSVPKSDKENSKDFCERTILKNKHDAMLEHGTVYLRLSTMKGTGFFITNPYSKVITDDKGLYNITTNVRVLLENNMMDLLENVCEPTKYHHKRYTISCITGIDISREFNRHRVHSIAEQSTRYCNFSKDRFGREIIFIKPYFYDNLSPVARQYFDKSLKRSEKDYLQMCEFGCSAQEARKLLPLDTKTHLVHTAFIGDWNRWLSIRLFEVTGKVYPDMKILAAKVANALDGVDDAKEGGNNVFSSGY